MHVPNPDSLLVEAFDALLAIPQRRGVPLPALLVATEFAPSVGCGLVGLTSVGLVSTWLVLAWSAVSVAFGAYALQESRRLVREARHWDDASARRYRATALAMRERLPRLRGVFLAFTIGMASVCVAFAAGRGPLDPVTLCIGAYVAVAGGFLCLLLGYCAMPRDPDLRQPMPAPRAA